MKQGHVIWEEGDDYHGSGIVSGIYLVKENAQKKADDWNKEQPNKCSLPECTHKYTYSVMDLDFEEVQQLVDSNGEPV